MSRTKQFYIQHAGQIETCARAMRDLLDETGPIECSVKPWRAGRSLKQNRLYWLWLSEISEWILSTSGKLHPPEDLHEFFAETFLPSQVIEIEGRVIRRRSSTATLKVREFSDYLNKIEYYALEHLFCELTRPDDLYWAALMKEAEREGRAA